MRNRGPCLIATWLTATAAPLLAEVFSSEFVSDPVAEGWELSVQSCEAETWNADGWYHQALSFEACPPDGEGRDSYRRSLESFNGTSQFFVEFRIETDGDQSEIPFGAPALVAFSNSAGVLYHITVASDRIQFLRAAHLPILFIEIEPGVPHTFRIQLRPERYAFYIDGDLIDEGVPRARFRRRPRAFRGAADRGSCPATMPGTTSATAKPPGAPAAITTATTPSGCLTTTLSMIA